MCKNTLNFPKKLVTLLKFPAVVTWNKPDINSPKQEKNIKIV